MEKLILSKLKPYDFKTHQSIWYYLKQNIVRRTRWSQMSQNKTKLSQYQKVQQKSVCILNFNNPFKNGFLGLILT